MGWTSSCTNRDYKVWYELSNLPCQIASAMRNSPHDAPPGASDSAWDEATSQSTYDMGQDGSACVEIYITHVYFRMPVLSASDLVSVGEGSYKLRHHCSLLYHALMASCIPWIGPQYLIELGYLTREDVLRQQISIFEVGFLDVHTTLSCRAHLRANAYRYLGLSIT